MSYNPKNPNGQATSANSEPVVIASDQSAVNVSMSANSSVNVNQVGGTAVDANSGLKSAGTQRVVLATDQPQLTNALKVDGSATTQPVSGTVTANMGTTNGLALDASVTGLQVSQGSATSGQKGGLALGAVTSSAPTYTNTQSNPLSLDTTGSLRTSVTNSVTVGVHGVSQSGTWTVQPGNTANTTAWLMNAGQVAGTATAVNTGNASAGTQRVVLATDQPALTNAQPVNLSPTTSGGWSVSSQTSLTAAATVSGVASKFGGYMFINLNATAAYIQVFNLATSGAVTLGTTTPTFVVPLPANSTAANGAGANLELTNGIAMSTGIQVAATTTPTGATTVTTGLTGFVLYK